MKSATFAGGGPRLSSSKEMDELAKKISERIKAWAKKTLGGGK